VNNRLSVGIALLLFVAACGGDSTGPGRILTSIAITPAAPAVPDGGTTQLTVVYRDQDGQTFTPAPAPTVSWSSSDGTDSPVFGFRCDGPADRS
jgi:hypothetical protein